MRTISAYLKPYVPKIALGVVIKFIGTMMDLVLPWLLAILVDEILPTKNIGSIYLCGALMAICAVVAVTFNVGANRMAASNSSKFTESLRHDLFVHITYLPAADRDRFAVASLVSRLTNDTYNVHQVVDKVQRLGIRAPLLLLGGVIFAFSLEPALALVLVCICPLLALVIWRVTKNGVPLYSTVQKKVDVLVRTVRENAIGVRVIKALSKTDHESKRFSGVNNDVTDAEKRAARVMAISNPAMTLMLNTGFMLVILVGAFRANIGLTQPGQIMAFLSYFTIILNAVLSITKMFVLWSRGAASAQRITEVMNTPIEFPTEEPDVVCGEDHISCSHVTFSYNGTCNNIEDINFSLKRGQTLGIIGPTGSGKTTLISVLLRFYSGYTGDVRVCGQNMRGIPVRELRSMFGVAFQNDALLNESVYENISFLRGISREQVERAARVAQIDAFIQTLPEGYETKLDIRGANLSGGQKQRVLIARALAGQPDILVLDDAESALDYRTDAALRQAIRQEYSDTTTIIVSQRISAIRNADWILLLEDGRVEGAGTHAMLMNACEGYRKIARVQMGGDAS